MLPEGGSILSQLGSALSSSWKFIFQRLAQAVGALPPVRDIALDIGTVEVYRSERGNSKRQRSGLQLSIMGRGLFSVASRFQVDTQTVSDSYRRRRTEKRAV